MKNVQTRLLLAALGVLAAVTNAGGCGSGTESDCESFCKEQQSQMCVGAQSSDCASTCSSAVSQAQQAKCDAEADAVFKCEINATDVCSPIDSCVSQNSALIDCAMSYCTSNPGASACGPSGGTSSTAASGSGTTTSTGTGMTTGAGGSTGAATTGTGSGTTGSTSGAGGGDAGAN